MPLGFQKMSYTVQYMCFLVRVLRKPNFEQHGTVKMYGKENRCKLGELRGTFLSTTMAGIQQATIHCRVR